MVISVGRVYSRRNPLIASFNVSLYLRFIYLQCVASLLGVGVVCGYMSLVTTLLAVACSHFDKLTAAILVITQQHITPQPGQEDEQVDIISNCDLQSKLIACIRHHQDIIE